MKKRLRHTLTFSFFRPFFKWYLKIRFNYTAVPFRSPKNMKGPYLILSNHGLAIDPFLLGCSFRFPIFFVASDIIFTMPVWSPIIRFLVSPIPKTKYRSDTETIRDIVKMIRSGGCVGIFPEGNATFCGKTMPMPKAIGKLIKLLKVPVLFYQLDGGYLSKPRWAKHVRKGKMTGRVVKILEPKEYRALNPDEIFAMVEKTLAVDIFEQQKNVPVRFVGKRLAEDFESAYFFCPNCGGIETLESDSDTLRCTACSLVLTFTPEGYFHSSRRDMVYYRETSEWYTAQTDALETYVKNRDDILFQDDDETVYEVPRSQRKQKIGTAHLQLSHAAFNIDFGDGRRETWSVNDVLASVQQKNWLILYNIPQEKTYYFIGSSKRNALKYVLALEALKKGMNHD